MLYLLDTNAVSDLARRTPTVENRAARTVPADQTVTCTIVVGEVRFGIAQLSVGRRRNGVEADTSRVLSGYPCVPVPAAAADHYATIKTAMRQSGRGIGENDLWIAATALSIGAVLVSRDADVQGIPGLAVEDWSV